jgi:hypothetical protein
VRQHKNPNEYCSLTFVLGRFWSYVKLFAVMCASCFLGISTSHDEGHGSAIFEAVKCLSAAAVFFIFVLDENVRKVIKQNNKAQSFSNLLVQENQVF